jgi:hypothetical protein
VEKLKTYPVFQHLRANAESHQLTFRPKESLKLQNKGTLNQVLDNPTESAWNILRDCRANGMNLHEAEELALPCILLPSEQEEEQDRLDRDEQDGYRFD